MSVNYPPFYVYAKNLSCIYPSLWREKIQTPALQSSPTHPEIWAYPGSSFKEIFLFMYAHFVQYYVKPQFCHFLSENRFFFSKSYMQGKEFEGKRTKLQTFCMHWNSAKMQYMLSGRASNQQTLDSVERKLARAYQAERCMALHNNLL